MCAPSLDPPQLRRRQSFVIRKSRTAIVPAAAIPPHFLDAENAIPEGKEDPSHSSWASSSETPVWMHNPNATADVSPFNGISAILGQHKAYPDRDVMNGRGLSPPPPFGLRSLYAHTSYHLTWHTAPMIHRSHSDDVVLLLPPSPFSQWTPSPFTVDLVEYDCADQFMMASNARLFGDDLALSAILATDDPRAQKCLDRNIRHFDHDFWQQECVHSVLRGNLAKSSQNDEIRLALGHIDQRRLPEASPHDKLWGIGLSACDPESTNASTVSAPLWPRPLAKRLRTYRPARQHCDILTKR